MLGEQLLWVYFDPLTYWIGLLSHTRWVIVGSPSDRHSLQAVQFGLILFYCTSPRTRLPTLIEMKE